MKNPFEKIAKPPYWWGATRLDSAAWPIWIISHPIFNLMAFSLEVPFPNRWASTKAISLPSVIEVRKHQLGIDLRDLLPSSCGEAAGLSTLHSKPYWPIATRWASSNLDLGFHGQMSLCTSCPPPTQTKYRHSRSVPTLQWRLGWDWLFSYFTKEKKRRRRKSPSSLSLDQEMYLTHTLPFYAPIKKTPHKPPKAQTARW